MVSALSDPSIAGPWLNKNSLDEPLKRKTRDRGPRAKTSPKTSLSQPVPPSDSFGTLFHVFDSHESLLSWGVKPPDCSSA